MVLNRFIKKQYTELGSIRIKTSPILNKGLYDEYLSGNLKTLTAFAKQHGANIIQLKNMKMSVAGSGMDCWDREFILGKK